MGNYEFVKLDVKDYIATVTMDRPPVNALSMELYRDITNVFKEVGQRIDDVRVAILTGAGRCFCAGRDLKSSDADPAEQRSDFVKAAFAAVYHCEVPVIAAVHGFALGAGFATAANCDFIIAAEGTVFGLPQIDAGLCGGMAALCRWLPQSQARRLSLTGERLPAQELYRLGMLYSVVPPAELMPAARTLAGVLASKSPLAMRGAKWSANEVEKMTDHEQGYRAIEARVALGLQFTEDHREAVRAFVEKRKPVFKGK